jgi:hypothetical protein
LPDGLRAALPVDEFEFRYPLIGLQVKSSAGISGAEGNVVNNFARSQDMGKTQKYSKRVNYDINLSCQLLDQSSRAQDFGLSSARGQYGRVVLRGNPFQGFFNLIDRLRQVCAAESMQQMDGFRNRDLRLFSLFCHDTVELYRTSRPMAFTAIFGNDNVLCH